MNYFSLVYSYFVYSQNYGCKFKFKSVVNSRCACVLVKNGVLLTYNTRCERDSRFVSFAWLRMMCVRDILSYMRCIVYYVYVYNDLCVWYMWNISTCVLSIMLHVCSMNYPLMFYAPVYMCNGNVLYMTICLDECCCICHLIVCMNFFLNCRFFVSF